MLEQSLVSWLPNGTITMDDAKSATVHPEDIVGLKPAHRLGGAV